MDQTQIFKVDPENPDQRLIAAAAQLIQAGEVVAFPTETVYGLGANGLDPTAVTKIFAAKGRPADNPLILHISSVRDLEQVVVKIPPLAQALIQRFWPGPLTLVLPKKTGVPDAVTAGLPTVAVRMPAHPVAQALITATGLPIAAPSANISGRPSPTLAGHVWADLNGRIAAILDGGPTGIGLESTVVDLSGDSPCLLRPGGVSREELEAVIGPVGFAVEPGATQTPKAPGMKYRHYAPQAPVWVVSAPTLDGLAGKLQRLAQAAIAQGEVPYLLVSQETAVLLQQHFTEETIAVWGSRNNPAEIAHNLFSLLRSADEKQATIIYAEGIEPSGLGAAVMNRLLKAAGGRVLDSKSQE